MPKESVAKSLSANIFWLVGGCDATSQQQCLNFLSTDMGFDVNISRWEGHGRSLFLDGSMKIIHRFHCYTGCGIDELASRWV